MERSSSFGTSWADQWDYNDLEAVQEEKKRSSGVKNGVEKTKAAASTGLKKVKEGTTLGFQWIKDKYQKRTQKN